MTRDDVAIADILLAARRAVAFLGTLDQLAFERDDKTQSATLHHLLVIGEATKRVPRFPLFLVGFAQHLRAEPLALPHAGLMHRVEAGLDRSNEALAFCSKENPDASRSTARC